MVLPASGQIAISQIGAEFYGRVVGPSVYGTDLTYNSLYNLNFYRGKYVYIGGYYTQFPSGQIAMSNFHNAAACDCDCNCACDCSPGDSG